MRRLRSAHVHWISTNVTSVDDPICRMEAQLAQIYSHSSKRKYPKLIKICVNLCNSIITVIHQNNSKHFLVHHSYLVMVKSPLTSVNWMFLKQEAGDRVQRAMKIWTSSQVFHRCPPALHGFREKIQQCSVEFLDSWWGMHAKNRCTILYKYIHI